MERRHLTLLLVAAAALGAWIAPTLVGPLRAPPSGPVIAEVGPTDVSSSRAAAGSLSLDLSLDRAAVLQEGDGLRYLVVTVEAPASDDDRVAVDVAMVIDTSGSMGREGKIEAARAAADELVDALRVGDRFSLVSFDDRARVLVEGARLEGPGFDSEVTRLHRVVAGLRNDGGTNLWDGFALGEDQLGSAHPARKVLVVSDGEANVGETSPAAFARLAQEYASQGVSVSAIGLGRDFNENLLEGMADAGGGSYRFVGNPEELPAVIAAELERTTKTLARQARVRVHAADGVRIREVYGWTATHASGRGTSDRTEVYVGDISAGQTRKIVLALEVPTSTPGERPVAWAELDWVSVGAVPDAAGKDGRLALDASATVHVTADSYAVSASVDEAATVAAARARAGALSSASADAWRRGDGEQARAMMRSATGVLAETLAEVDAPDLRADQEAMHALESLGETEGDSYAAKAASEAARVLSR